MDVVFLTMISSYVTLNCISLNFRVFHIMLLYKKPKKVIHFKENDRVPNRGVEALGTLEPPRAPLLQRCQMNSKRTVPRASICSAAKTAPLHRGHPSWPSAALMTDKSGRLGLIFSTSLHFHTKIEMNTSSLKWRNFSSTSSSLCYRRFTTIHADMLIGLLN